MVDSLRIPLNHSVLCDVHFLQDTTPCISTISTCIAADLDCISFSPTSRPAAVFSSSSIDLWSFPPAGNRYHILSQTRKTTNSIIVSLLSPSTASPNSSSTFLACFSYSLKSENSWSVQLNYLKVGMLSLRVGVPVFYPELCIFWKTLSINAKARKSKILSQLLHKNFSEEHQQSEITCFCNFISFQFICSY